MTNKQLTNELALFAFTQNPIAMVILDENAALLNINSAFERLTGYNEIDCHGKPISFFDSDKNLIPLSEICTQKKIDDKDENNFEIYLHCKSGKDILVRKHVQSMIVENKMYTICTFEDIMEEKRMLEHFQHLAMHDPLTGLANRVLLEEQYEMAELRAVRHRQKMALLICDINGFKEYNDRYGHEFGDKVLKKVSKKLEELLRRNDIVSRYGGDEFVLILEDISHSETISKIVAAIKTAFPITVMNNDKPCLISMSIGSACYPSDGRNFSELIQIADRNMYKEKNNFYGGDRN